MEKDKESPFRFGNVFDSMFEFLRRVLGLAIVSIRPFNLEVQHLRYLFGGRRHPCGVVGQTPTSRLRW